MSNSGDPLAYGHYNDEEGRERGTGDSARGFLSDTFKKFTDKHGHQDQQGQYAGSGQGPYSYQSGNYDARPPSQQQGPPSSGAPYASQQSSYGNHPQTPNPPNQDPQYYGRPLKQDRLSNLFDKLHETVAEVGSDLAQKIGTTLDPQAYAQYGSPSPHSQNRYQSFAPQRKNNDVKWYVDGSNYFWAVSRALESARESIYILDWWLSPELYLRRPPAQNEQYRLDRMLQAAAQRGVQINIIVYKEVEQALSLSSEYTKHTLEALHPNIAVFRHPDHLPDTQEIANSLTTSLQSMTLRDAASIAKLPGDSLRGIYGTKGDTVLFWAHHEKLCLIDGRIAFMGGLDLCFGRWDTHQHAIADVHPGDLREIVFPGQDYNNARVLDFQNVAQWERNQLNRKATARMGWSDISISLRGPVIEDLRRHFVDRWNYIYDTKYYARKETRYSKLLLYGQPSSFPGRPSENVSSGYNQPTSVQPQQDHPQWQQQASSQPQQPQPQWQQDQHQQQQPSGHNAPYSPAPPASQDQHPQYQGASGVYGPQATPNYGADNKPSGQYYPPPPPPPPPGQTSGHYPPQTSQGNYDPYAQTQQAYSPGQYGSTTTQPTQQTQAPYFPPPPGQETQHSQPRGFYDEESSARASTDAQGGVRASAQRLVGNFTGMSQSLRGQLAGQVHQYQDRYLNGPGRLSSPLSNTFCQIVRSCTKWSGGIPTEHSIQDAYVSIIRESEHFVYIENQFFITATSDAQRPVQNKIGAAIVERILRAARAGQKYKIIVIIPSVPGFAGDLRDDSALGTRAIMEFQYNSINRGGHSIMEAIAKEGYNPMEYIRFYNLRNYDRINTNSAMLQAEQTSGIDYEDARRYHDAAEVGYGGYGPDSVPSRGFDTTQPNERYQQAAHQVASAYPSKISGRWDSVSECYMLGGEDIRNVPWDSDLPEIDAFVSEELYIHSKVLIADDRTVICGSANLNDRSQLGSHDSEIAVIIQDPTPIESTMDGRPWMASRFAASLRRELFRKHLGLLKAQDYRRPTANCEPVGIPNEIDLQSPESQVVADPLSDTFQSLWNSRARTNTEVFRKVFNVVPDDNVRNWDAYREFYEYYFRKSDLQAEGKEGRIPPAKFRWGHVVRDNFPPGPDGIREVKELLSKVKGNLVEMPLMFLIEEDIAKEGLTLNALTEEIYT